MRIAILSDVHGNLVALDRVLETARGTVDAYVCLGDVVNYGPWNDECLLRILDLPGAVLLEGNHERLFRGVEPPEDELPLVQAFYKHSRQFFRRLDLITDLPLAYDLGTYRCVHTIDGQSIYADTPIVIAQDYIVGHTHHQYHVTRSGHAIVNPGSVGQSRQWIDRAEYAVFDTESGAISLHSVEYDVDKFISELRSRQYPEPCIAYYADKVRKGDAAS